jgi:transcriptional regulator with XRE-family HTH domain
MKEYLDKFKQIPYTEQSPMQRWAVICVKERRKKDWVRREMAQHFGVVTSTVTFWEQGKSYPKNEYVYKMAELIKVTPNDLINHLNNTQPLKHVEEDCPNIILEKAESMSPEELGDVIAQLLQLLVGKKPNQPKPPKQIFHGQLSLGL